MKPSITVSLGPMAQPLTRQIPGLAEAGIHQKNADAISRLHVQGIITDTEAERARFRLTKRILVSTIASGGVSGSVAKVKADVRAARSM